MKKKIVIIGYGGMGGWHVNKISDSDVVECVGIYDIKEARRELARERNLLYWARVPRQKHSFSRGNS